MADRYWVSGNNSWVTQTTNWSTASALSFTASCSSNTLTTVGSPALVAGMQVYLATNSIALGTIVSGSGNTWTVSTGGTAASQTMRAATTGASPPTASDNVIFDENSSGTSGYAVSIGGSRSCLDLIVSGGTPSFSGTGTLAISGSMTLATGSAYAAGAITFNATTTGKTITTNGVTINANVTFNGTGGGWTLGSALTLAATRTVTLTAGALNLDTYTLTTGFFNSSGTNTRVIAFGTGNITVNGAGGTLWTTATTTALTTTGTQVVNVSYAGAVATTITSGSLSEANSISFNFTAGTYTLTLNAGTKRNLNFTGFAGTVGNTSQTIYGNLTLSTGGTFSSGANAWTFAATSTGKTITCNGKAVNFPLTFNGVGGSWILQDALNMASATNGTLTHTNGTIDLNGKTLTVAVSYITATGTKNLTFNGGTLACTAASVTAFNNAVPTGFTTTAGTGTGTISMTAATAKTFVGGDSTFNCTLNQGGAGNLTISGGNTFNNITNTVQPATVIFPGAVTTTFNNFNLNGTAGNLIFIENAGPGSQATISKASGTVSCDYLNITDSAATGGASWYAGANSVGANTTGWIFTAPPTPGGNTGAFFSIL